LTWVAWRVALRVVCSVVMMVAEMVDSWGCSGWRWAVYSGDWRVGEMGDLRDLKARKWVFQKAGEWDLGMVDLMV